MRWIASSSKYSSIPPYPDAQDSTNRPSNLGWSLILSVFPIMRWIHRYDPSWLIQDMIAGATVGIVSVPQSIAYAKLANLAPQYGLYTAFVGSTVYCLFGTSKDINIGPITTVSLLVGQAVNHVYTINPSIPASEIGVVLALFCGLVITSIGVIRLGFLVDFIPGPAIGGYMTGSAITIAFSQLPSLNGTAKQVNTHLSPFRVLLGFLSHIPFTRLDAIFGIMALVCLYVIKFVCSRINKPVAMYINIMRSGLVVICGTVVSYWINIGRSSSPIQIVKDVPSGLGAIHIPNLNTEVLEHTTSIIPSILIILIIEHISVAKTFGRISDYAIDPNQEIKSIGASNIIGSFLGAYPGTGAFSRTAIMSRSGAMTPMAGVFSGAVILLALYILTPAFYYIPDAILAATVIHAVSDLVSSSGYVKDLWRASTVDFVTWLSAVLVSFFFDVETGIYVAVAIALASLLAHIARPTPQTLGCARQLLLVDERDANFKSTTPYRKDLLVFRPVASILYPNADHVADTILRTVKARVRGGSTEKTFSSVWKDMDHTSCSARDGDVSSASHPPQILRAILLDMRAVRRVDATALQALVSLRYTIDAHVGQPVDWHFANIFPEVRIKLLEFGFGQLPRLETAAWAEAGSRSRNSSSDNNLRDCYPCFHWDMDTALLAFDNLL